MPDIYVVLGYANCRKSSTVRALTGASRRGMFSIATAAGISDFFVQITSLQEAGIMPATFSQEMRQRNSQNILTSLWITERTYGATTYPAGIEYFREFLAQGWTVRGVSVLGANTLPYQLPTGCPVPNYVVNPAQMANNQIASQIRNWWHWV